MHGNRWLGGFVSYCFVWTFFSLTGLLLLYHDFFFHIIISDLCFYRFVCVQVCLCLCRHVVLSLC